MSALSISAGIRPAREAAQTARLRARMVRIVRLVAMVLIGALVANIIIQSFMTGEREASLVTGTVGDAERITNPRFTGRDQNGRPFVLTADSAVRRLAGLGNLTDLENPRIDYALLFGGANRPDASEVLSQTGLYDDRARILRMSGTVRFSTHSGYRFRTEGAALDLAAAVVTGDLPVEGRAPWGGIQAQGFELHDDGRRLVFTGGVVTRFYTGDAAPAAEEDE
ncbi:MAG: LPS export ABC transporter periplasmic protein LptC [Glycocaulis sp.]